MFWHDLKWNIEIYLLKVMAYRYSIKCFISINE